MILRKKRWLRIRLYFRSFYSTTGYIEKSNFLGIPRAGTSRKIPLAWRGGGLTCMPMSMGIRWCLRIRWGWVLYHCCRPWQSRRLLSLHRHFFQKPKILMSHSSVYQMMLLIKQEINALHSVHTNWIFLVGSIIFDRTVPACVDVWVEWVFLFKSSIWSVYE